MTIRSFFLLINYLFVFIDGQRTIHIGIIDDFIYRDSIDDFSMFNVTVCDENSLNFEFHWIDPSTPTISLFDQFNDQQDQIDVYLIRTEKIRSDLIENYCQTTSRLCLNLQTTDLCSETIISSSSSSNYSIQPDVLQVFIHYLKFHSIRIVAYVYDHHQSNDRIYKLLQLMSHDEYFNNFSLEIRTTYDDDVYSLLYSIESHSFGKSQISRYVILDLPSFDQYQNMFEKISHMGLVNEAYNYIIFSKFDVCQWLNAMNFTGRLIYFDDQFYHCTYSFQTTTIVNDSLSVLPQNIHHHRSYYRSTLSFRSKTEPSKTTNSSRTSTSASDRNLLIKKSCSDTMISNSNDFSFQEINSKLPNSSQLFSRSIIDALNLLVHLFSSNRFDCKTLRVKSTSKTIDSCSLTTMNVFTMKKSTLRQMKEPIELIGQYSPLKDQFRSCQEQQPQQTPIFQSIVPSQIYYITSVVDEPFLMLRKRRRTSGRFGFIPVNVDELRGRSFQFHELEGYCVELAERICSILNITCQFRIVEDGNFGSKNASTGQWNGMVGDIVSRRADMAIAPLTISQKRMEVVDFSKPFMNLGISIMIRKPDAQKPGVFSFMNPVSMEIWLCFSLSYVAVSVVLFLTSRVVNSAWRRRVVRRPSYRSFSYPKSVNDRRKSEIQLQRQRRDSQISEPIPSSPTPVLPKASVRRRHHYRTRPSHRQMNNGTHQTINNNKKSSQSKANAVHNFGISNALFFSFSSFMRQSINLVPKSLSGRVAATSWWYFSLIFISSYTANLVAFLTVEKLVTPIESVEDLAKQQEIKYGSVRNGTTSAFFEKSNVSVFQHMWAVMQRSSSDVFVASNDEGVRKVRDSKGKYAFFIESTKNEYVNERLPCDTMKVGSDLDSKGYGIATRLGSDLTEAINIIITNLRESGFLDKLKQRWWYERSECSQGPNDKRFSELSLSSVTGLFYIFLFGIILSCIIAFMEFLITAKTESRDLDLPFREILRIKMIENMVGITIQRQRQLEFGRIDSEFQYQMEPDPDPIIEEYTAYQLNKPQSDV